MRQTTGIILVGARATDSWGGEIQRPTHVVRLTQNSVPGWQVHPLEGAAGMPGPQPTGRGASSAVDHADLAAELVVLVAVSIVRDVSVIESVGLVAADSTEPQELSIPDRGFSEATVEGAAEIVATSCRLWVMPITDSCALLDAEVLERLRGWGVVAELRALDTFATEVDPSR